jgi:tetratricopeptide (TPR) repeat protein
MDPRLVVSTFTESYPMFNSVKCQSVGLLVLLAASSVSGQAPSPPPPSGQPPGPGLRTLTGADARRANDLDKAIDATLNADRWDEAIAKAEELLALRTRVQGSKHFETVNAEWRFKALRRVAPMPKEDRIAFRSAITMYQEAEALNAQGQYAAAQPLFEKALEINRRCSPMTTPIPLMATAAWRTTSTPRASTRRPSR